MSQKRRGIVEPPFHDAPFFILKKAKNENILINTISISETNKRSLFNDLYKEIRNYGKLALEIECLFYAVKHHTTSFLLDYPKTY